MSNKMFKNKFVLISIASVLLTSTLAGCGKKAVQQKKQIPNVNAVEADLGSISEDIEYSSKLTPLHEVNISPKTGGKISALNVSVGSHVNQGDTLFKLDTSDSEAALNGQEANLAAAQGGLSVSQATLDQTAGSNVDQQVISANQAVRNAQLGVESAQTSYNDANTKFQEAKVLYDKGAMAKYDYDSAQTAFSNAKTALENAQSGLNTASSNLSLLKGKSTPQSVNVAQARVQQSQAQVGQAEAGVESAQVTVDNGTVSSPVSGTVSVCSLEVGEMVSNAVTSLTVIDTSYMLAEVDVPDKMVGKVQIGQTIPVKISTMDNKAVDGVVDTISPAADSKTQSYTIKVKIPNSDGTLKSGMFARVALTGDTKNDVITVPNEAVQVENTVPYIYTVKKGKVKKVAVSTGLANDKDTEVTKGIDESDEVITSGQIFLNDGEEVKVVK